MEQYVYKSFIKSNPIIMRYFVLNTKQTGADKIIITFIIFMLTLGCKRIVAKSGDW